jgi:hypothetical protein
VSVAGRVVALLLVLAAVAGCGAKRLPPGTPPPEYETRALEPWSGDAPDAGTGAIVPSEPTPGATDGGAAMPAPSEQPKTEPVPLDAGMNPFPDAGVR